MRAEWWPKITVCIVVYIPPPFLRPVTNSSRHHTSVLRDFHHPPIHDYVSAQTSTFLKNFQLFFKNKTKSNLIFIWPYSSPARFLFGFTRFDFPIVWVPQTVGFFLFECVCVVLSWFQGDVISEQRNGRQCHLACWIGHLAHRHTARWAHPPQDRNNHRKI